MNEVIEQAKEALEKEYAELSDKSAILRSKTLRSLYSEIKSQPDSEKASFGQAVNALKVAFSERAENDSALAEESEQRFIDVTAPFDTVGSSRPGLLGPTKGSKHPISIEMERIIHIFTGMGFKVWDSRQLDDDFHMFGSLNFPDDHPARDDYDTFMTEEGLIPPAHTSTMQHRVLKATQPPIRAVIPGRVYRNEDVDATHGHTFYQVEGVYVDENITLGDMLGTIQTYLEEYFEQEIEFKTQPFYFPFTEPGMEFLIKMPDSLKKSPDDDDKWLEIMGCGMIHPNVLEQAGVDSKKYSGFAWGFGLDRMVMLRHGIEDIRHFHSAKLDFLKQFKG